MAVRATHRCENCSGLHAFSIALCCSRLVRALAVQGKAIVVLRFQLVKRWPHEASILNRDGNLIFAQIYPPLKLFVLTRGLPSASSNFSKDLQAASPLERLDEVCF